jgi:hypothetical protein
MSAERGELGVPEAGHRVIESGSLHAPQSQRNRESPVPPGRSMASG